MPDIMSDEFLSQRDISDPVMGFVLMAAVYVIIPVTLVIIGNLYLRWRRRG